MSLRDGTGPFGLGPGSGRRKGRCCIGSGYRNASRSVFGGRNGWLLGLAASFVTAVLRDLMSPSGILHRIAHIPLNKGISGNNQNVRCQAEVTVIDENTVSGKTKKGIIR